MDFETLRALNDGPWSSDAARTTVADAVRAVIWAAGAAADAARAAAEAARAAAEAAEGVVDGAPF